jgi:hypothetical protein
VISAACITLIVNYIITDFVLTLKIGIPVYCMSMNPRRRQIACGFNGVIRIYGLDESKFIHHINGLDISFYMCIEYFY